MNDNSNAVTTSTKHNCGCRTLKPTTSLLIRRLFFPADISTGRNRVVVIGLVSDAGDPGSTPVCDSNYRSVQLPVCV
jgi:hypothetical protein